MAHLTGRIEINTRAGVFTVRPFAPGDERAILHLFREVFGTERTLTRWRWAYEKNPAGARTIMLAFAPDGTLAAQYAGTPYRALWHGEPILVNHLIDSMTHPRYRAAILGRKGLFVRMTEHYLTFFAEKRNIAVQYGFPGVRHRRLGNLLLRYSNIKQVMRASRRIVPAPRRRGIMRLPALTSLREESFDNADCVNPLVRSAGQRYPLTVVRDGTFLRWRFGSHPESRYRFFILRRLGRVRGYAVVTEDNDVGRIVDYVLPDGRSGGRLLEELTTCFDRQRVRHVETWCDADGPDRRHLETAGFVVEADDRDLMLVARSFRPDLDIETEARGFFFTMGDSDLY